MLDPKAFTVFVTGATSGFGAEICRRFAKEGSKVIAAGRRQQRLAALKKELGDSCYTAALDVRDPSSIQTVLDDLPSKFRKINVLVANAGLALGLEPAHQASLGDWKDMVDTNISGVLNTVRAVLPGMVERDEGHIVLMGSVAGDFPYPGGNVYGATKAFVKQFALNLRSDLLGANVRVTCMEPGLAETEFSLIRFKGDREKAKQPYEGIAPLSAEDVAESVYWSCTLPRHVNVNRLQLMPVMQAFGPFAFKRSAPAKK